MPIHADKVKGTWETSHLFLSYTTTAPKKSYGLNSIKLPYLT